MAVSTKLRTSVHQRVTHINLAKIEAKSEADSHLRVLILVSWPRHTTLVLSNLCLGGDDAAVLGKGIWPFLEKLDVHNNWLRPEAVKHLVKASWPNLKHLDLCGNRIGQKGMADLSKAQWPLLKSL